MSDAEFRALLARALDGVAAWESGFGGYEVDTSLEIPHAHAAAVIDELV